MTADVDHDAAASRYDYPDSRSDEFDADGDQGMEDATDDRPSKKKRRFIKDLDKKFDCPHTGCGKKYSRAEHLYRHQLNHAPKEIYRCDFAGCDRSFVRSDLCTRHKERHNSKGSHLHRKDIVFHNSQKPAADPGISNLHGREMPKVQPPSYIAPVYQYPASSEGYTSPTAPDRTFTSGPDRLPLVNPTVGGLPPLDTIPRSHYDPPRSNYNGFQPGMNTNQTQLPPMSGLINNYDSTTIGHQGSPIDGYSTSPSINVMQPPQMHSPTPGGRVYSQQPYASPVTTAPVYQSPPVYTNMPPGPSYSYPPTYGPSSLPHGPIVPSIAGMTTSGAPPMPGGRNQALVDFGVFDQMTPGYAMPVFGSETPYMRSPSIHVDDGFMNYLFSSSGLDFSGPSPSDAEATQPTPTTMTGTLPDFEAEAPMDGPQEPDTTIKLDINLPENTITQKKQARLLTIVHRWHEIDQNTGHWTKEQILNGNSDDPDHVMSLQMLRTYIASFWVHIHPQMPILHRPTFNPETCPIPLLLSMICLGATCLERTHPPRSTTLAAELAFFMAYHIRWEVFKDAEFRPTAKLWTFQTMLLLELFEKMYSTRPLHERAHIHHATTLTVMRRGSSLVGRSAMDGFVGAEDPTRTPPGPDGSINTSGQNTADAYWNRWITAEATRRAAFAAFTIDSTHATLFGHAAVMSPHDLRLPLPCDEALWSATSGSEVQRVEASLAANGFKSMTFLEGLRRTLNAQKVRTNTFGRVVLMAGLLNVTWQMNQRDLQVSSLGASHTLGSSIRWRSPLTRAFDFWRRDFDDSLARNEPSSASTAAGSSHHQQHPSSSSRSSGSGSRSNSTVSLGERRRRSSIERRDNVFESRTCLHSLAHMAMHVDIIDCQVFAGAENALGRPVTESDRTLVQRRMREQWAPTARARDAVFYAIRFLVEVLLPENDDGDAEVVDGAASTSSASQQQQKYQQEFNNYAFRYSARDDYLLNRPWVLYFATLIVWAYGYALDGPLIAPRPTPPPPASAAASSGGPKAPSAPSPSSLLPTHGSRVRDLFDFLRRMSRLSSPDDLEKMEGERNRCLGLLLLLQKEFAQPRWELLHEASESLGSCARLLVPGSEKPAGHGHGKGSGNGRSSEGRRSA